MKEERVSQRTGLPWQKPYSVRLTEEQVSHAREASGSVCAHLKKLVEADMAACQRVEKAKPVSVEPQSGGYTRKASIAPARRTVGGFDPDSQEIPDYD